MPPRFVIVGIRYKCFRFATRAVRSLQSNASVGAVTFDWAVWLGAVIFDWAVWLGALIFDWAIWVVCYWYNTYNVTPSCHADRQTCLVSVSTDIHSRYHILRSTYCWSDHIWLGVWLSAVTFDWTLTGRGHIWLGCFGCFRNNKSSSTRASLLSSSPGSWLPLLPLPLLVLSFTLLLLLLLVVVVEVVLLSSCQRRSAPVLSFHWEGVLSAYWEEGSVAMLRRYVSSDNDRAHYLAYW